MSYCDDCGCRTSGGICSNCHEELYILEYQSEFIDEPLSREFTDKADEQRRAIAAKAATQSSGRVRRERVAQD